MGLVVGLTGCHHPAVTAVSLAPHVCDERCTLLHGCHKDPEGIPFYLPKPLLIVAKNFRNIEDAKVGLTDTAPIPNAFDDQGKYADLNARASFNFADPSAAAPSADSSKPATQTGDPTKPANPAAGNTPPASTATKSGAYTYSQNAPNVTPQDVPDDGLAPNTFFTYQIVFVPDLTQKYGLKVSGGVGEIRAAMNLVNGWQFTGLGPYYMKDSSTAQDVMASGIAARLGGQAVQDVLKGVAGLSSGGKLQGALPVSAPQVQSLSRSIEGLQQYGATPQIIPEYAEIYVYEARLGPDGQMEWCQILDKNMFNRHYLGQAKTTATFAPTSAGPQIPGPQVVPQSQIQSALPNSQSSNTVPTNRSFLTNPAGGLDPNVANLLSHTIGAPITNAPVTGSVLQAGTPSPTIVPAAANLTPAASGVPGTRPLGAGLFHHDKNKRGTAKSTVLTIADQGGELTGNVANPSQAPTARTPTTPVPPVVGATDANPALIGAVPPAPAVGSLFARGGAPTIGGGARQPSTPAVNP